MYLTQYGDSELAIRRFPMSIELLLERPVVDEPVSQLVQDLMDEHAEVLIIGVRPPPEYQDPEQRKHTLAVYVKAAENGGHLLPYLKDLVEELVQRYDRAAAAPPHPQPRPAERRYTDTA
jgi:hypothetical protein